MSIRDELAAYLHEDPSPLGPWRLPMAACSCLECCETVVDAILAHPLLQAIKDGLCSSDYFLDLPDVVKDWACGDGNP